MGSPAVVLRLKGGPGSGHHGHRGRPGKRGGSLPGTAGAVTVTWDVSQEAVLKHYFQGMSAEDVEQAYKLPGYDTEMTVSADGFHVNVNGKFLKDGEEVGMFHDRYYHSEGGTNGDKMAVMELLAFENDFQNAGLARGILQDKFALWKESGFKAVQLDADSVGRYAWAKKGFNYDNVARWTQRSSSRIVSWADQLGIDVGRPKFNSAQDVANFTISGITVKGSQITNKDVPGDMDLSIGKAFMLDMGQGGHGRWDGNYEL